MGNTAARAPTSASTAFSSLAWHLNSSGSFCPMWVWASNSSMGGSCPRRWVSHSRIGASSNTGAAYPGRVILTRMEELRAGQLEATFHPELGMVGSSLRHRGEELLG